MITRSNAHRSRRITRGHVPLSNVNPMDDQWRRCEGTWDRLRWARINAGFDKAVDAAKSLGLKPDTYRAYEREPGRSKHTALDHQRAMAFAKKFKVSWTWLLLAEGSPEDADDALTRIVRALEGRTADQQATVADLVERLLKAG